MTEITLTTEQKKNLAAAEAFLNGAKQFKVDNVESYMSATRMLKDIKSKKNEYDNYRKVLKAPILKAGKNIDDFFREPINFLTQAEQEYKKSIARYLEQEEKNDDTKEKKTEINAKAVEALKNNDLNGYNNAMIELTALQKVDNVPKVDGISVRDNWKGRVTDFPALIQAVLDKKAPISLLTVDETVLNNLASSVKDSVQYPGIEFYNQKIVAVRA